MPALYEICERLRRELPGVKVRVYSDTGGTLTPNPWHVVGVSCRLKDLPDRTVEVEIMVAVLSLTSAPEIEAYVKWDWSTTIGIYDEIEQIEAAIFARPVPVSDEAVQMVRASLPLLVGPLKSAVERGFPRGKGTPDPHPLGRAAADDWK